tara:strand:- start:13446 stop:21611 length:8166 start_codon:yes stop_codon:yes gene_type:complete
MIETSVSKIKISDVVQSQIPSYVDTENPLFADFLKSYYYSQEFQGGPVDIAANLVQYKNLDFLSNENLTKETKISEYADGIAETIYVDSTRGWPKEWGLLKVNNEIITYTGIGSTSFTGCVRGFSGIENLSKTNQPEYLTFSSTGIGTHGVGDTVENLSSVFLNQFLSKLKVQILNGFENRSLFGGLDQSTFIRQAKDFFKSKGTEESFKILFKVLYGEEVDLITPQDFVIRPSDANFVKDTVLICESFLGNPKKLIGYTITQGDTSGSVTGVEEVIVSGRRFYKIRLSTNTIEGTFKSINRTLNLNEISVNDSSILVDSTVGFGTTGTLTIGDQTVTYGSINLNQFLDTSALSESVGIGSAIESYDELVGYEDGDLTKKVCLKILVLVSDIELNASLQRKNTVIPVLDLGSSKKSIQHEIWLHNNRSTLEVDKVEDLGSFNYRLTLKNPVYFNNEDVVEIIDNQNNIIEGSVVSSTTNTITVFSTVLSENTNYKVRRKIRLTEGFVADVQNLYDGDSLLVASNSIPHWGIQATNRSHSYNNIGIAATTNYLTIPGHNLRNGELLLNTGNTFSGISSGSSYYVRVRDQDTIYLSETPDKVRRGEYITIYENDDFQANAGTLEGTLTPVDIATSELKDQKLLSTFGPQEYADTKVEATRGIGLFANGVEIFTPKSDQIVRYGSIASVEVLNSGEGYDVVDSPRVSLVGSGIGATMLVHTKGPITEIIVDTPGTDYQEIPTVSVFGGNGTCVASPSMKKVPEIVSFNAGSQGGVVNTALDKFVFKKPHNFINGEEVIYGIGTTTATAIGIGTTPGTLVDSESYFVSVKNDFEISLSPTGDQARLGIGTIPISSNGTGEQTFTTKRRRFKVGSILVEQSTDFENKTYYVDRKDISKGKDMITIRDHGFSSGDLVTYDIEGSAPIVGLTSETNYYVIKIDDDNFRLSESFTLKPHVDIVNLPLNVRHIFKYPDITVSISGRQGITTSNATATPVARGSITKCIVKTPGEDYGSAVINGNFKPEVSILGGSRAELRPYIVNGRIEEVIVKSGGFDFFTSPDIVAEGSGVGAKFKATVLDGKVVGVKVINPGSGYDSSTVVKAKSPGIGAILNPQIEQWTVDNVFKFSENGSIKSDDGFFMPGRSSTYGKQYINLYAPRNLRTLKTDDGSGHSPILGWAYDGSPIYGPYAFTNTDGTGPLKYLKSSYVRSTALSRVNGPDFADFPSGYFVEDYSYVKGSGDLDEHNGRFCITPEYPNGVYAYFVTVSKDPVTDAGSPFFGSRKPEYPYVIGTTFKFKVPSQNFDIFNDQNTIPNGYKRNTAYQNFGLYEFVSTIKNAKAIIKSVTKAPIDRISVLESGINYAVNDSIVFDNSSTSGFGALAKISSVAGVGINSINSNVRGVEGITLITDGKTVTGIATLPHRLLDNTYVKIAGISSEKYSALTGLYQISVEKKSSRIDTALGSNNDTTTFGILDNSTHYNVGDVVKVGDEEMFVYNVDHDNNNLSVTRGYNGTVAAAHTNRSVLTRQETKFKYELKDYSNDALEENYQVFFDASADVGVGMTAGVGIGTTVSYVGPGNQQKEIFIPTRSIRLPNHGFRTGEELTYDTNGGLSLPYSYNGTDVHDLPSTVYAVNIEKDLIGIVTNKSQANENWNKVFFNANIGIGNTHSFKTNRNVVTADANIFDVVVSTGATHQLRPGDEVTVDITSGITRTVVATYDTPTNYVSIGASVNPPIVACVGDTLKFDVSDATLEELDLDFFVDNKFEKQFYGTGTTDVQITRNLSPGISSATVSIHLTEDVPSILYYNFTSRSLVKIVSSDIDIANFNQINVVPSRFAGLHAISTTSSNTFTYNIFDTAERVGYGSESTLEYTTKSLNARGPIDKVALLDRGRNYDILPILSVTTDIGDGAKLLPVGSNVGVSKTTEIIESGYDYPSDKTITVNATVPKVIVVEKNLKVDSVDVISGGVKYLTPPRVVVYNTKEDTINDTPKLETSLIGGAVSDVKVVFPGGLLSEKESRLISLDNTNGVGIISATYSDPTVTLRLKTPNTGFTTTNPLPFAVGEKVFVENVGVSSGLGYNSEDYRYKNFTLTGVNTAFGLIDQATISYELDEDPGSHDGQTFGSVSRELDLPTFKLNLVKTKIFPGEVLYSDTAQTLTATNTVKQEYEDYILVDSIVGFKPGDKLNGQTSGSIVSIKSLQDSDGEFMLSESFKKTFSWDDNVGKLNVFTERIQDSDYYQQFAYSLKSRVGVSSWSEPVDSLAHIAGYKKHSDLIIDSQPSIGATVKSGISSSDKSTILLLNGDGNKVYCKHDFDSVFELTNDDQTKSDKIVFKSERLSNNILALTNRVLEFDDISPDFYDDPDIERNIEIDSFQADSTVAIKYYAQIVHGEDSNRTDNIAQYAEFIVGRDDTTAYVNDYSKIYENFDIGKFNVDMEDSTVSVTFAPYNTALTYDITFYKEVISAQVGFGTTSFANINLSGVTSYVAPSATPEIQTIQSFDTEKFKSGYLSIVAMENGNFDINEAVFVGIGSTVHYATFGKMDTGAGIGTFSMDMTGTNDLQLQWHSVAGLGVTVSTFASLVGIATTSADTGITTNKYGVGDNQLGSHRKEIAASGSPVSEVIATYNYDIFTSVKLFIQVENVTDNEYSVFNLAESTWNGDTFLNKFANLSTNIDDPKRDMENTTLQVSGNNVLLKFTPRANKEYIIRTSEIKITKPDSISLDAVVTLQ